VAAPPFEDSRRLTGINPWFDGSGAVLEVPGGVADGSVVRAWRERVERSRARLDWPEGAVVAHAHASGVVLAFGAPIDQLYAATEVNEWSLLAALAVDAGATEDSSTDFHAPGHPAARDEESASHTLAALARAERTASHLVPLATEAGLRGLNVLADDEALTLGSGAGGRTWPLADLPEVATVGWDGIRDIPIALVTGSNGKTTTVRLLAAMARTHGWRTAHSCTDGVFVDAVELEAGDYSGPAGARTALRRPDIDAAILETARGGILRRGLAVQHADVAIVTNVSDDHFGEYGVHDLDALARVKLVVARALGPSGLLIVNADDDMLVRHAPEQACPLAWFALDDAHPLLGAHRDRGGATCGIRAGRLHLCVGGVDHDLGAIDAMPLTFAGNARYTNANIAAASLGAAALGIDPATIATVLSAFGAAHADNPGRLQHWSIDGVEVFVDYAHNPEGLRGLLGVAAGRRGSGRLGVVLGQAGNREDADIRGLAAVAAGFGPDRVVLKDIEGYERGRRAGEVAALLREELICHGVAGDAVIECLDEVEAARGLLDWARAGDVLLLPIHAPQARREVVELLDGHPHRAGPARSAGGARRDGT
jgi:UDP-N-acetylmuramyl tripeptide synthase